MTALADMMSYIFAEAIMIMFLLFFNVWLGIAGILIILLILLAAKKMNRESMEDPISVRSRART